LALLESSFETGDELAAEDATKNAYREKEGIAGMDPAGVVRRKTSGRNHTVDMGMMQQVLTPGMQDGKETDLSPQVFGVAATWGRVSALARKNRS
jgi:hypothetical protein